MRSNFTLLAAFVASALAIKVPSAKSEPKPKPIFEVPDNQQCGAVKCTQGFICASRRDCIGTDCWPKQKCVQMCGYSAPKYTKLPSCPEGQVCKVYSKQLQPETYDFKAVGLGECEDSDQCCNDVNLWGEDASKKCWTNKGRMPCCSGDKGYYACPAGHP